MITIIFAPPRTGKTCYMTHLLTEIMFDSERNRNMTREIARKREGGFSKLTFPTHCVSANYDVYGKKYRYSTRYNRRINPYRLGYSNDFVSTHFNLPFEAIGITEAQKYLNSRMSMYFPDWQSRWYEQHGHNNIDIFLDTQRPMLIDVNIRELSSFVEIVRLQVKRDKFGKVKGMSWLIREIENSSLFDAYMSSGKRDYGCFRERVVTANYNVFECYDSQLCKPKFYDGHFDEDFDYSQAQPHGESMEEYLKYLQENDDELPPNFYQRRKSC